MTRFAKSPVCAPRAHTRAHTRGAQHGKSGKRVMRHGAEVWKGAPIADLDNLTGRERFRIARDELDLRNGLAGRVEESA